MVAICLAPYTRATVETVDAADQRGVTILALTDSTVSPIARTNRSVLVFRSAGPSFLSTMAGALALTEILIARLAATGGDAVIERLAHTDAALRESGAYWDSSWTRFPAEAPGAETRRQHTKLDPVPVLKQNASA